MDEYDGPWKEAIEEYFEDCLAFFFPKAYNDIDWQKGYEFLDKELQKIDPEGKLGVHHVDKLVKVHRLTGEETWVLIHIDVQSQYDSNFTKRMYVYNYRLFDRYDKQVASFAILGDERPKWKPKKYEYKLLGCQVRLRFPSVKLLDYHKKWDELEQSDNPFATIVMAHLYTKATKHDTDERYRQKWYLIRRLYEKGYKKRDVLLLFRFIEWLMALPPALKDKLDEQITVYEEDIKVEYITSIEQRGIDKGIQQGVQKGTIQKGQEHIVQILKTRFGKISQQLVKIIHKIDDATKLDTLFTNVLTVESVEKFSQFMDELMTEKKTVSQDNGRDNILV